MENTTYYLGMIFIIIALVEISLKDNLRGCLQLLGAAGAVFLGFSLKYHDFRSLMFFASFVLVIGVFYINLHAEYQEDSK